MTSSTALPLPSHCVRARRYFFGPRETCSIVYTGTRAECAEFISRDDAEVYRTSHNEAGRWSLRIVTTASLRPSALQQAEQCAYDLALAREYGMQR